MSSSLVQWRHKAFLSIGVSLRELPHWSHHVPSLNGWGQCGVRETEVNYTVRLEQQVFLLVLRHCHMLVHFNIDVLYHYDNNQESMLNGAVYLAWKLIRWVHPWLASLREKTHFQVWHNGVTDALSRHCICLASAPRSGLPDLGEVWQGTGGPLRQWQIESPLARFDCDCTCCTEFSNWAKKSYSWTQNGHWGIAFHWSEHLGSFFTVPMGLPPQINVQVEDYDLLVQVMSCWGLIKLSHTF